MDARGSMYGGGMAGASTPTVQQIATLVASVSISALLASVTTACGGSSPITQPDATPSDGPSHDAIGRRGSVSVTVNDLTALAVMANALVAFIDPDGTTTIAHTNASGHASALVAEGASVTVKYSDRDLQTILDVQPGDDLVFGAGHSIPAPTVTISFTPLAEPTLDYFLFSSCTGGIPLPAGGGPIDLVHCDGSLTDADVYVLATRRVADVSTAVASLLQQHVDLTADKPIMMPDAWVPADSLEVSYTNPIDIDEIITEVDDRDHFAASQSATKPTWTTTVAIPSTGSDRRLRTIVSAPRSLSLSSSSPRTSADVDIAQILDDHLDLTAATYTADVMARLRPWLSSITYDPATRMVSTTTEANAALDVDAVQYQLYFGTDVPDAPRWSIYAPTIASFVVPAVPDSFFAGATIGMAASVDAAVYETPALVGWDVVRPKLYTLASESVDAVANFGTLYVQRYTGFHPAWRN